MVGALGALAIPALGLPAAAPAAPARQEVAVLQMGHVLRSGPSRDAERVGYLSVKRPITEQRTTVPVVAHDAGKGRGAWLKVMVPGRPNGRTAWISAAATRLEEVRWRITIDRSAKRARAYYLGQLRRSFKVVVGKRQTPTPLGDSFVEENIREPRSAGIGPFALALSSRSAVFQEFAGGPGQIALHGVGNLPGALGTAASHGCVRFSNASIRWLAARIDPGSVVSVVR